MSPSFFSSFSFHGTNYYFSYHDEETPQEEGKGNVHVTQSSPLFILTIVFPKHSFFSGRNGKEKLILFGAVLHDHHHHQANIHVILVILITFIRTCHLLLFCGAALKYEKGFEE